MSNQYSRSTRAPAAALVTLLAALSFSAAAVAGPSAQHTGAASSHASAASAHAGTAVVKGVAAVAATPLIVVGASGMASAVAGSALYDYASEPLKIGHEVIHTAPPNAKTTPTPAEEMAGAGQGNNP